MGRPMSDINKKALKKLLIRKRNKRDLGIIHHQEQIAQQEEARQKAEAALIAPGSVVSDGEVVWSAKTQEIRNRLNGKKRMAGERWNRFAGTSDGGGRGL